MKINTTPGETYIVLSTGGCTVTTGAGKQIKRLAAGQDFFTAMTGDTILSDDNASVAVAKGEMLSLLNTDSTGSGVQATLQFQPVASQSALPTPGENGVIYLVPNNSEAPNQYTEWVWTGSAYEQLGDVGVDLDGYVSKEELGITNIEAGETGPQVTSDATLITKAAQVESLRVGDFVSVRPSDEPYGLKDITITSTVVTLNEDSNITLSGDSRINLSNTSWLGNEKAQLNSLTIMAALTFGSYGQYKFDALGDGNLRKLNIDNSLDLGSAYYLDAYGEAQLRTLYLGLQRIYYLDSTGEGRMDTLTLDSTLNLGNTYFLNSDGGGGLHQLSIVATLKVGSNLDVGGDLSLMGTLHLGGGDTYYLRPNGVGSLVSLGLERLTVMTALHLGDSSDAAQPDQAYGLTGFGDGTLRHLSVMGQLFFAAARGNIEGLTVMTAIQLGFDDTYYLDSNGARLDDLSVMGDLRLGPTGGWKLTADGDIRARQITAMGGLYLGGSSKYYLSDLGDGNLNELSVISLKVGGASGMYGIDSTKGYLTGLTVVNGLYLGDGDNYYLKQTTGRLQGLTVMDRLEFGESNDTYLTGRGSGKLQDLTVMGVLDLGYNTPYFLNEDGDGKLRNLAVVQSLTFDARSTIGGDGWPAIVTNNIVPYLPAAAAVEAEQPSFATLTFPPTGTATEEQDPSWITKSHILMQTNGGQLNMTQLTATLAYAAQDPMSIANKTLWLSTSSGTGDAVQWPANAVFPDDQPQDKIQQLNSDSTYWFDITYVGGSDTVLIRKVCSWAATTGENGPTE